MQSKRSTRILKNIAALLLGQVTTNLLSLLVIIYIPRRIGPFAMGELTIANILTSLVSTFLALGISTVLVRDIARDPRKAADFIGAVIVIRMLMALPSLALIAVIAQIAGYTPEVRILITISSVGMVISTLTVPIQGGFQALERMKYNSLSGVVGELLIVVASVAVVLAGGGVILLSLVNLMAALVLLFLNIKWWRSMGTVHLRFDVKLMRYLLVGGLPFWASGLFFTIYLYVDSFLLSVMTTDAVVGWYSVPTSLFGFLLFIPTILTTAIFPALVRTYKQAPGEMVKLARRSLNVIICLSLPMAVGGGLLSKQIIFTLYGYSFNPSIPILTVLSAMVVPTYLNILINQFVVAVERQMAWTKLMAVACVVNPLINFFLISYYQQKHLNGAYGAAWALLLTEGLQAVVGIALLPRGILGWSNVISGIKSVAAAGLMALAVWYTRDYFIAVPIATGGLVYSVAVLLLGVLPREDFALLQMMGAKVFRKFGGQRALSQTNMKAV